MMLTWFYSSVLFMMVSFAVCDENATFITEGMVTLDGDTTTQVVFVTDNVNTTDENMTTLSPSDTPKPPSSYLEFKIGSAVNYYAPPIITAFGTFGNSICIITMSMGRMSSPRLYILALAVVDMIMIWLGLFQYWALFNFYPQGITNSHCHGMFFMVNFVSNVGVWIICAMTVERTIVVYFPLKAPTLCSVKKTRNVLLSLIFASAAKNIHYIWTADFIFDPKTKSAQCVFGLVNPTIWHRIYQWFDTCVSSIVPFLLIMALNCAIIYGIKRSSKMQKASASTNSDTNQARDRHLTAMLLSVSMMFVLLTSPLFVLRTYFTFADRRSSTYTEALYHMLHHIFHKLWYTNNAINFYILFATGERFREETKSLFKTCCGLRKAKKIPLTSTLSKSTLSTQQSSMSSLNSNEKSQKAQ